ncbi:MAG: prolipoprotein diacylglyceryl transferase [Bacteroidetes bacterium]|nr:prolipoprotein diacylglyceryl transferase [Bacteroidota bacterium]
MYPKISDFINDVFGTNINLPIQSYGFFVALAFLVATLILYYELKRKEKEVVIPVRFKKVLKGKPAGIIELSISFILGLIIGYKIIGAILIYSSFAEQPGDYIFSLKGNIWGGLAFGAYSLYSAYRNKKKDQLEVPIWEDVKIHPYELTASLIFIAAVSGIIGAKIFHQLENIDEFLADPLGSLLSFSGLTFYGGLIVAGLTLLFYAIKKNIPKAHLADAIAPVLMIGYAIGRIGCQVAGDGDWGIVNLEPKPEWLSFLPDWLWAYDYPHNVLNMGVFIDGCEGTNCFRLANPVFPTPVYETITCLIMFLGLWLSRKRIKIPGVLFSAYLILNGIERFFIEKIRVNETYTIFNSQITQAEIISILLIIAGILSIFLFVKHHDKNKITS